MATVSITSSSSATLQRLEDTNYPIIIKFAEDLNAIIHRSETITSYFKDPTINFITSANCNLLYSRLTPLHHDQITRDLPDDAWDNLPVAERWDRLVAFIRRLLARSIPLASATSAANPAAPVDPAHALGKGKKQQG